jgi:hypothetical protein
MMTWYLVLFVVATAATVVLLATMQSGLQGVKENAIGNLIS